MKTETCLLHPLEVTLYFAVNSSEAKKRLGVWSVYCNRVYKCSSTSGAGFFGADWGDSYPRSQVRNVLGLNAVLVK